MKDLLESPVVPVITRHGSKANGSQKMASGLSSKLTDGNNREFFWGCTLSKETPSCTWSFTEEDDDQDFLEHTLFLKQATLGPDCKPDERHVVCLETKTFTGTELKQPIINMKAGHCDNLQLDLVFQHEVPVTFRLIEGSGPIHLSASQLVELPLDSGDETESDPDDTECTATEDMTEDDETEMTEETEDSDKGRGKKRKKERKGSKTKRGKMDSEDSTEDTEESDKDTEETEETADSDEESAESESEEEKPKRGRKGSKSKAVAKGKAKGKGRK